MEELRKFFCPEIIFGNNAINQVGQYATNLGIEHALLVTDKNVSDAGWKQVALEKLREMGASASIFQEVEENCPIESVMSGLAAYKQNQCNGIIALGGGSVIDCAKTIGILASNAAQIEDLQGVDKIGCPAPPLLCIPTTCGSSADVSQFAIVLNRKKSIKMALVSKKLVADVSLIDPQTLTTLPEYELKATTADALVHAIEAYVSNAASPITDAFALNAIRRIANNSDFSSLMLASLEAGMAFSNASLGLCHAMSHSLGGITEENHGYLNGFLLPKVIEFNYDHAKRRYQEIHTALTNKTECTLKDLLGAVNQAIQAPALEMPSPSPETIQKLTTATLNDACIVTNPRWPSKEEVKGIYARILAH
ncbi:MAG: iron-containing alcohol dehydrogenase [Nanobdellota archaeon]